MVYPNYKDKHIEAALFNPDDFVSWNKAKKIPVKKPTKYILIYYPKILKHFKNKFKTEKINYYRLVTIHRHENIGVVLMTGIGSPNAVTVLEELIALGGKEFVNIGSAGGLQGFGIFLCDKAIRDEGTSHHYIEDGKYSYPDKELTDRLRKSIKNQGLEFQEGTTWTIDAPYRETRAEIFHYKKQGVKTVEMEASALFAVGKVRGVKVSSAFSVSDILGEGKWRPEFDARHVRRSLNQLMDAAVYCLLDKP